MSTVIATVVIACTTGTPLLAASAKLAKADGLVTVDEVATFARVFRSAPGDEAAMRRVFDIARQTVLGYESYARRIAKRYRDRPCLLEGVLDGLFRIAAADGTITGEEMDYLRSVSDIFGFNEDKFRRRFGPGFRWNRRDRIGLIELKKRYDLTDAEDFLTHLERGDERGHGCPDRLLVDALVGFPEGARVVDLEVVVEVEGGLWKTSELAGRLSHGASVAI